MAIAPESILKNRPNRTAKGMTKTLYRSEHHGNRLSADALTLSVRGTLDALRFNLGQAQKSVCKCCGAKTGKLVLSERGRVKLMYMRRAAEQSRQSS